MSSQTSSIVRLGWTGFGHPVLVLKPAERQLLRQAMHWSADRLTRLLECHLQTSGRIALATGSPDEDLKTARSFFGALHSTVFLDAEFSEKRRLILSRAWLAGLPSIYGAQLSDQIRQECGDYRKGKRENFIEACVAEYEHVSPVDEACRTWRGWPAENRSGRRIWLPLLGVHDRFGPVFADAVYVAAKPWIAARQIESIPGFSELCAFLASTHNKISIDDLKDPVAATSIWSSFARYYFTEQHKKGNDIEHAKNSWRAGFQSFVHSCLIPQVLAEPIGGIPMPPIGKRAHGKTEWKDGKKVFTKLVTNVPLQATDEEAMEILFSQIQADVHIAVNWARQECDLLESRIAIRTRAAPTGTPVVMQSVGANRKKMHLISADNPDRLANLAATFRVHGFIASNEKHVERLYGQPTHAAADLLGIPRPMSLLPHCILLVFNHPCITPSFLEKFKLYDKNGKRVGLVRQDAGFYLRGFKDRKGKRKTQQNILLNAETLRTVRFIMRATAPLRRHLKKSGNPNWRFLLLNVPKAFGSPKRLAKLTTLTSLEMYKSQFAASLKQTWQVDDGTRLDYARRFSLSALRASVGVLEYIKTGSSHKMSEALGHEYYSAGLLRRYLPEPILSFFQNRWIRIFQAGVTLQVMKDSPHAARAAGFRSAMEISQFLTKNALPAYFQQTTGSISKPATQKVLVNVSVPVLTALLKVEQDCGADSDQKGVQAYWACFSRLVCDTIESGDQPALKHVLAEARVALSLSRSTP